MRIGAFSAMTMLAGFCAGHVITDSQVAIAAVGILVIGAFFAGVAFSGELK